MAALLAAVAGPLRDMAAVSVAAHMVRVLLLIDVAPLLLLLAGARATRGGWPITATGAGYAVVLWAWHAPAAFRAAVLQPWLEAAALLSFLLAGLAFWAAFASVRRGREGQGIVWAFVTMLHTGLLGAVVTFAPPAAYAAVCSANAVLTPAEDQQLAGLLMWVPGGGVHLIAALVLVARLVSPGRGDPDGEVQPSPGATT